MIPEAEINLVVGQTKVLETRKPLRRIAVANPLIADIELLSDQPNTRLMNLYGKAFGTTSITFWEADENPDVEKAPVTFIVRVSLDTLDLEKRINQSFPGAAVKVRQVGPQVILEGQVPDSKTMADVLLLVNSEIRNILMKTPMIAGGTGGMTGGMGGERQVQRRNSISDWAARPGRRRYGCLALRDQSRLGFQGARSRSCSTSRSRSSTGPRSDSSG